jgi:hypothetical protein
MHRLLRHASGLQLLRQRVCQAAAGCEECNDADYPRVDPALCLALGKEDDGGACQFGLCRFENAIHATRDGIIKPITSLYLVGLSPTNSVIIKLTIYSEKTVFHAETRFLTSKNAKKSQ